MSQSHRPGTHSPEPGAAAEPAPEPPPPPPRPPLKPGRVLAAAARVGRGDPWRILAVSIVLAVASTLVEIAAEHLVDEHSAWQVGLAVVITEGVALLGTVLLSGFLCRLTGESGRGGPRVTLGHVIRTLPWGRLVLADLLVTIGVIIGLLALVIPGLVLGNLLSVVGPLIEIEDHPVRRALRRSARLVRPYFWEVALLAIVPVIVVSSLESVGPEPSHFPQILAALAIRGVIDGVLEAVIGLILVQLCYQLIALDAATRAARRAAGAG